MREQVLITPRAALEKAGGGGDLFQGFSPYPDRYLNEVLRDGFTAFMDRELVETIPALKQLIPYVVLSTLDGHVICYQRGKKSGEQRLLGKKSLGLGGHISLEDGGTTDVTMADVLRHARRELNEELKDLGFVGPLHVRGLINDDSDEVGSVHLGIVIHGYVNSVPTSNEEGKILGVEALTATELIGQFNQLEKWSQVVSNNLPFIRHIPR